MSHVVYTVNEWRNNKVMTAKLTHSLICIQKQKVKWNVLWAGTKKDPIVIQIERISDEKVKSQRYSESFYSEF